MNIDEKMAQINEDLKGIKTGITLKRRNKRIYLQGILPPKPGKEIKGHHQQEIALGLEANEENILMAKDEALAKRLPRSIASLPTQKSKSLKRLLRAFVVIALAILPYQWLFALSS